MSDRESYAALLKAKEKGLVLKTGFSLYFPAEAERLLSEKVPFDIVQVPYSLVDRRFEGMIQPLRQAGVEVHVRSVFLQGLLLMAPADIPVKLSKIKANVELIREYALENKVSVSALCAGYALSEPNVDKVVMGVDSLESFLANLDGLKVFCGGEFPGMRAALDSLKGTDEELLLPQNWKI